MRALTAQEQTNATYLAGLNIEFSFLLPTATGLGKSIMDATAPLRDFFRRNGIHDYNNQEQGPDHKVYIDARIAGAEKEKKTRASLYRPITKKGDPRIWFYGLKSVANANEMLAICTANSMLYALNLSASDFQSDEKISSIISELRPDTNLSLTATELLAKLNKIARSGFIPAECSGSTAIGRTLETALGIPMNSSQDPDYKGIEIKTKRRKSSTRKTLFAKVPDWNLSKLDNFRQLIDQYGYDKNGLRRLNCTVSALRKNTQGLQLAVEYGLDLLFENGERSGEKNKGILVWSLPALRQKLSAKHQETFWVNAETRTLNGREEFLFNGVEYTNSPRTYQLPDLLAAGLITIDHLIKEKGKTAHERGPLFKSNKAGHQLLFPDPVKIKLGDLS